VLLRHSSEVGTRAQSGSRSSLLLLAGGIVLAGYLLGREVSELARSGLAGLGTSAGAAAIAPLPLYVAVVAGSLWVAVRLAGPPADPRPALTASRRALAQAGVGLLVAGLLVAVAIGIAVVAGWGVIEPATTEARATSALVAYAILYTCISLNEELVFRGALLGLLGRWGAPVLRVVATSVLFAAVHVLGSATWERLVGVFLLGVLLALLRIGSGSLWPAVACHWGFHVLSYGAVVGVLPAQIVLSGPQLLVGRPDQLDAGLISIISLAAAAGGAALVIRMRKRYR